MTRQPDDVVHDSHDDVSEGRRPTPAEREVLELLDLDPGHRPWVRLSITGWNQVDRIAAALHDARAGAALPSPRPHRDDRIHERR